MHITTPLKSPLPTQTIFKIFSYMNIGLIFKITDYYSITFEYPKFDFDNNVLFVHKAVDVGAVLMASI